MQEPRIETKESIRLIGPHGRCIVATSPDANAGEIVGPLLGTLNQRSVRRALVGESTDGGSWALAPRFPGRSRPTLT